MSIKMKKNRTSARIGTMVLATGLTLVPAVTSLAAVSQSAGSSVVDPTLRGSLTIHKYDMTSAAEDGAYEAGSIKATGQRDSRVENALQGYGIRGVEFSYLHLGEVETQHATGPQASLQLLYELPEELLPVLGLTYGEAEEMNCGHAGVVHYTGDQISDALADLLKNDNVEAKNELEKYLLSSSKTKHMPKTDVSGYTTVDDLEQGLYLVVETEVPEMVTSTVDPWFVQIPYTCENGGVGDSWAYDVTCYPKNQTGYPTLDKSVKAADEEEEYDSSTTASEGETLEYILVSKLPQITSSATYLSKYTFVDTLSAGLAYNRDVQIAFYHTAADAAENQMTAADWIWNGDSGMFTATVEDAKDAAAGTTRLIIALTESGLAAVNGAGERNTLAGYYMVVSYTAQLNSDAAAILGDNGNPNDVQLEWSRTSEGFYETLEDRNYVYTYGLDLTKEFSDHEGHFDKVQFRMLNANDGTYVVADREADGVYRVTGDTEEAGEATALVPGAENGNLKVLGLEADTYQITELTTDEGYSLLKKPVTVEIRPSEREVVAAVVSSSGKSDMVVGEVEPASALVDDIETDMKADGGSLHALAALSITNSRGFLLPQTGGSGLYAVTILGVLTAAAGCVMVIRRRRESD